MARTSINRSISFDPEVFDKMEKRRSRLLMDRSEYVKRCILRDMLAGGSLTVDEAPAEMVEQIASSRKRAKRR